MVQVKALKNFYGTGHGDVRKGKVIEVSEASARAMIESGLVAAAGDGDVSSETKSAPAPNNKMQPPARNKSHDQDEFEPGIVRSTANDLGAGGAQPVRGSKPSTRR
jgi:hypothetical protein